MFQVDLICCSDECRLALNCGRHQFSGVEPNKQKQDYTCFDPPAENQKCQHFLDAAELRKKAISK